MFQISKLLREGLLSEQVFYHGSKRNQLSWENRNEQTDYNMLGYGIYLTDNKDEAKYYASNDTGKGYLHTYTNDNANVLNWFDKVPEWLQQNTLKDPNFYDLFIKDIDFDEYELELEDGCSIGWDWLSEDLPEWALADNFKPGWFIIKTCNYEEDVEVSGLEKEELIKLLKEYPKGVSETIVVNDHEFYGTLDLDDEMNKTQIFNSIGHLYLYLFTKLGSTKVVTKYLTSCGLDGVIGQQDTTDVSRDSDKPTVMVIYNPNKFKTENITSVSVNKKKDF